MQNESDIYLLNRIKADSAEAFEILYKRYFKVLYGFARIYLAENQDCEDVVQDVLIYLWNSRSKIEINTSLKSYLLSSCQHRSLDLIRKNSTKQRYASRFLQTDEDLVDGYDSIYESFLRDQLDQAMEELPEQCRKIFYLSRLKGLRHKEIAKQLSLSPKTVEVQIYRALKILRKAILFFL